MDFGKAVLDWETWSDNPARALGHLVPDLVIAVTTGGAGAAVKGVGAGARTAGSGVASTVARSKRAHHAVAKGLVRDEAGTVRIDLLLGRGRRTNAYKPHLTRRDLEAARRELHGG